MPVAVGLFGISEILLSAVRDTQAEIRTPRLRELLPSRKEWRASAAPMGRGTILGFFIGILPGRGHVISTFVSYSVERRISKHPEQFGQGAVEGVAGPESANNSATTGAFVPMLAPGLPSGAVPAIMLAAMMIHGIEIVRIPFKGIATALVDLISGQVQAMFSTVPSVIGAVRAGKVRPLGVTSLTRDADLPDVPTIAESGMPGFDRDFE